MSIIERESALSGLTVRQAMRKLICRLSRDALIQQAIRHTIKYKVNAVLIHNEKDEAIGVVTKVNILGGYYAGLPITAPLDAIMVAPPVFCQVENSLDSVLDLMRRAAVQRLYVVGEEPRKVIGVLAYADILGMLYKYCHQCDRRTLRETESDCPQKVADQFRVCELMNPAFRVHGERENLMQVMESMSAHSLRTVLIKGKEGLPLGVVTATDLILAYMHGVPSSAPAESVMSTPARSCDYGEPLIEAVKRMIFYDLDSLYVHKDGPSNIVGVVTLADVARVRSGSCRACMISRIDLNE
jgi:signal-transduction protein with cAMP-binding, CBS, and nucleotidyltransferase domain